MPQPMQFNDLVNLVNGTIVENSTQDVTATLVNQALLRILEYSDNHSINDDRISSNIARMASVLSQIETAKDDIEGNLQPGEPDTLKDLLDYLNNEVSQLNTAIAALSNGAPPPDPVPSGVICMWSGTTPPNGWALCDGNTANVPDLTGKFIIGQHPTQYPQAGNYSDKKNSGSTTGLIPPAVGGEIEHVLTINNLPRHHHSVQEFAGNGADVRITMSGSHKHVVGNGAFRKSETFDPGGSFTNSKTVNDHTNTSPETDSVSHEHPNSTFTGRVGDGGAPSLGYAGIPATPAPLNNRPPYYVLAYIMKL